MATALLVFAVLMSVGFAGAAAWTSHVERVWDGQRLRRVQSEIGAVEAIDVDDIDAMCTHLLDLLRDDALRAGALAQTPELVSARKRAEETARRGCRPLPSRR
jgi:hypothetical protein